MKRVFVLLLVLALIPSLAFAQDATPEATSSVAPVPMGTSACPAPASLSGEVNVGALFTLSGAASVYGASQQAAVQLAVDEINAAGYLGGATMSVTFADSASDNDQAINAMTQLIEQDGVVAVIGPTLSREAFSADPVAQDAGVVVIGVSNTAIGITDMGDYVFRDSLPEAAVIPGVVQQAVDLLGFQKVGFLYGNDDDFTVSGFEVMQQAFADAGIESVGEETYATGDVDFNAQLTNLLAGSPDVLAVSALAAEAEQIILQARALGFTGYILGGNGFNSPTVPQHTGEASEGLIVGGAWNIGNPNPTGESVAFASAFEAANGHAPDQFAAQAYTGAWLVAEAIRCADSTDHAAIRDALAGITDFASPLGTFSFDENRNPVHPPIAQIVRGGAFVVLTAETGMAGQ